MKLRSFSLTFMLAVMLSVFVTGTALARSWHTFNLTVPKLGGSVITSNEIKENTDQNATVQPSAIGGGYTMSAKVETVNNSGLTNYSTVSAQQKTLLFYNTTLPVGNQGHLRLKNNITTPVNVQITGGWSPDQF